MLIYLLSLPIWNLVLPSYAYWHFDDFSWGDTRQTVGEVKQGGSRKGEKDGGGGEFDSSKITMKRWGDFEQERRLQAPRWSSQGFGSGTHGSSQGVGSAPYSSSHGRSSSPTALGSEGPTHKYRKHERLSSNLAYRERYEDYP